MSAITYAQFVAQTDAIAATALCALGSGANGLGDEAVALLSDSGARGRAGDAVAVVLALADPDFGDYEVAVRDAANLLDWQSATKAGLKGWIDALEALCLKAGISGVTSIASFAAYYNIGNGGPYLALLCPDFRTVYNLVKGSFPTATNCYSPAVSNMASRAFGASMVAGTDVDSTKYAGAAVLNAVTSSHSGTAGTLVVTGTARTSAGATVTGRTWTGTISGNGTVALTPANAGDLCLHVSAITLPGTMSAGTVQINAAIPGGRSNPPS